MSAARRGLLLLLGIVAAAACSQGRRNPPAADPVRTGADRIQEVPYRDWLRGKKIGLVTNQTGVDSRLSPTWRNFDQDPEIDLAVIFTPEHGLWGAEAAGREVGSQGRLASLYGDDRAPPQETLRELQALVYDIQDVGARYYTYISTMAGSMRAAGQAGIPFIVLDRPAPLNGETVQGPTLEHGLESFVGVHTIPARYALTPGEMAALLKGEEAIEVDLRIVPMRGWKRAMWYDDTGLTWIPPSPNMPTLTTASVYPGFCLLEGTNLSEGRGTTTPFELFGAPWLDAPALAAELNAREIPGARFRVQGFVPRFSKYADQLCSGVQVHITDRGEFDAVLAATAVLAEVLEAQRAEFHFEDAVFDRLAGTPELRGRLLAGDSPGEIASAWAIDAKGFQERVRPFLLY